MRFQTSDPDIETVVGRIGRGLIDLQPNFQRGEIWSKPKKQRLIDSILRRWHVPPIHLVSKGGGQFDVLDGQQRLTAIRDFVDGDFAVDGSIEPLDEKLVALDGLNFAKLPDTVKNEFYGFAIRFFELTDYKPDEPHELFFRLNQPTNLTEAEKRNAFIGSPRNQVRQLVEWATKQGFNANKIGFSNARMAYDDLLARLMLTIERESLTTKITAGQITARYREDCTFEKTVAKKTKVAIKFIAELDFLGEGRREKPNKATLHTWMCMAAELEHRNALTSNKDGLAELVRWVEGSRLSRSSQDISSDLVTPLLIFDDRATSRVADTTSVLLRDLTAWMIAGQLKTAFPSIPADFRVPKNIWLDLQQTDDPEKRLLAYADEAGWGAPTWL